VLTDRAFLTEPRTMVKAFLLGGAFAAVFILLFSFMGAPAAVFLSGFLFAVSSSWACLLLQRMLQPALLVHVCAS